jgi:uncharacterized protein YdhG (YjbR/CyaY superfamily)
MEAVARALPGAELTISYGVPTFVVGKPVVAVSASAKHCGLHLMSPALMTAVKGDLAAYKTTTSTIQFPIGSPIPDALVGKLARARLAENESRASGYTKKEARSA